MRWFCLYGYHVCCWVYLSHLSISYQIQVESYRNAVVAHVLTGNVWRDGAIANYIIGSSLVVDADFRTVLLVWVDISSCRVTMTNIGAGGGGRIIKPSPSAVIWMGFWVVASMDISFGNLKVYLILIGIVSVMTRIDISFKFIYYCPHLQRLNMFQIFLTYYREKICFVAIY